METGPRLKVSSDRLEKLGIEPATPGLQGKWLIHYTTAAPTRNNVSWSRTQRSDADETIVCCVSSSQVLLNVSVANSVDPDQTAPLGAV